MNLWGLIERSFHKNADRPAFIDPSGSLVRYGDLREIVLRTAENFRSTIPAGSCVAILDELPYMEAIYALALISLNVTVIPLSPKYGEQRCVQIIEQTKPDFLVSSSDAYLPSSVKDACKAEKTAIVTPDSVSSGERQPTADPLSVRSSMPASFVMYTSGSTGKPKGTILTYDNVKANMEDIERYFGLTSDDHILINRSLSHASVMTGEFLLGCVCGAQITFYNEPFMPRRLLSFMEKEQITVFCTTPTVFYQLAMDKVERVLPKLRKVALMGEYLHKQVALKISEKFPHVSFYMLYGQTEASPRITYLPPDYFTVKEGCIGIPIASMQAEIIDEEGNRLGIGEKGELIVKGPNVFLGYWENPELTAKKLKDGWLYTGDVVYRGEDNFLYIEGRKDDMIIRAGMNIYPKEIEDVLLEDERIRECVVSGAADPRYGQKLQVSVVPHPDLVLTSADVIDLCKSRLASYQFPDIVQIVSEIPRNSAGKIMRRQPV
ncbi:class I adenylate-forming enzyme family protein [Paenibacillus sp. SI8]|uniref:class I adenylate-forming enzyme family protein n=1 Tax=unclassified Paenibacillus TaxID=185978 RepID=UPI003465570C